MVVYQSARERDEEKELCVGLEGEMWLEGEMLDGEIEVLDGSERKEARVFGLKGAMELMGKMPD